MSRSAATTFRATLEPSGMGLSSTFARLPHDLASAWSELRVRRVKGEINGFQFRTALFHTPKGHGFVVNKRMLAGAGARQGDRVIIRLEPDLEMRTETTPEEMVRAMKGAPGLRKWFEKLPPGHRRWIAHSITEPKSAASRQKRAEDMAERLYLTMEGEKEPPPLLRAVFQAQPQAQQGWMAMTPTQRRSHLFLIFGCRSPQARQKRLQSAIEDALEKARSSPGGTAPRESSQVPEDYPIEADPGWGARRKRKDL